ncbi:SpaH/EbpB family LPXTG-anchored major pilin [Eubacterium sp.]|uniref:SpaH/EbpB family LPXTG-anchored major pilin n=1 Tax=Eubacterium sp. TaxID=142586 RepID=UPI0026E02005|nr:SpaH/EbpB family LPXTG-anchored major pilin [Eubacterium sp.]MDO5433014.1 SpaH/EbpB family LPXTG-anchored major pilin [Eubacterium sp.]
MSKKLTKLMSLCLALLLTVGMMSTVAFAAPRSIVKDTGTITVTGAEDSLTVSAYKIMDVNFDYDTQQPVDPEYRWADGVGAWVAEIYKNEGYAEGKGTFAVTEAFSNAMTGEGNAAAAAAFYDKLAAAIKDGTIQVGGQNLTETATATTANNEATLENLPMGNYLILLENGMKVYRPSAVNVLPEYDETNGWTMTSPIVELKFSQLALDKKINEATAVIDGHDADAYDKVNIGDSVNYDLRADVPQYPANATAKGYQISDTLPSGLTLDDTNSITVYGVKGETETKLTADTDYTLTTASAVRPNNLGAATFNINFKYDQIKSYDKVHIDYNAVLNKDAVLGNTGTGIGNPNAAYLDYNNNPYDTRSWKNAEDAVKVFTYGIKVDKVDKKDTTKLLAGAEFTLSANEEGTNPISFTKDSDGAYHKAIAEKADATTTLIVGESGDVLGKLEVKGLDEGTYYLTETEAPEGFNKLGAPIEIKITDSDNDGAPEGEETTVYADGYVSQQVQNGKGFTLPTTGGMGTILFTAGGILIMGAAVILILAMRKRRNIAE